jgi:hypothetical protein
MTKPKLLSHFEFVETLSNKFYSCQNAVVLDSVADPSRIRIRMFWASRIRIHWYEVRIRIPDPLSPSKYSKKNLDSWYCFVTSLRLFIFESECKCSFKK